MLTSRCLGACVCFQLKPGLRPAKWSVIMVRSGSSRWKTEEAKESEEEAAKIIIITIIIATTTTTLIIIIIAFKGAVRDFLQSPHCAVNCLKHVCSSGQSCENHVQHIECLSHASGCVPLGMKGQLSY